MKENNALEPTIFAIFGGAGDLTWRKLMPALFDLSRDQRMPLQFAIIVIDRDDFSEEVLISHLYEGVKEFSRHQKVKPSDWTQFSEHIHYLKGDFKKQQTYSDLSDLCTEKEKKWQCKAQTIFYMATPPSLFSEIPKFLAKQGLSEDCKRSRIVVEKPIGYDLESARSLNELLLSHFQESQIYRIDHYLGKETVQNILAFRFANPLFEPIWNRRYIDYVTITVAETVGVEHRGGYYDHAGALRDMVQNHLMQLLCMVAMEPMVSFDADEIRNKTVDVLHAVRPITAEMMHQSVVRGQYGKGWISGEEVCGYREEEGVSTHSDTETYAALKLFIDNWRWQDVPFYLRTGKRLAERLTEISIQFRAVPHQVFPPEAVLNWQPSRLILTIQPNEDIILRFQAKTPGQKMLLRAVDMRFNYREGFDAPSPDAYETLLWDVMAKDPTLFKRNDQVEAAWKILMPILNIWAEVPPSDFPNYASGTWGPEAAQRLLAQQGHSWLD